MNPNNPRNNSMIESAWQLQYRIAKRFAKPKPKSTRKDHWILTFILIAISGALGMWGTLTLWSNGEHYEVSLWIGPVKPLIGFEALASCILSAMLFGYAMENSDSFDE